MPASWENSTHRNSLHSKDWRWDLRVFEELHHVMAWLFRESEFLFSPPKFYKYGGLDRFYLYPRHAIWYPGIVCYCSTVSFPSWPCVKLWTMVYKCHKRNALLHLHSVVSRPYWICWNMSYRLCWTVSEIACSFQEKQINAITLHGYGTDGTGRWCCFCWGACWLQT